MRKLNSYEGNGNRRSETGPWPPGPMVTDSGRCHGDGLRRDEALTSPQASSVRLHTSTSRASYRAGVQPRWASNSQYSAALVDHTMSATS